MTNDLKEYGTSYSLKNLKYMSQFANEFTFDEISHHAGGQIPWRTIIEIIGKSKSHEEMIFYINETHKKEKSFDTVVSKLFFSNGKDEPF